MMVMEIIVVGTLGLILGSFFNVLIYRMPKGLSIVRPGSHCTSCGQPVKFYDNIPVLSYILLKGRCRSCHASFSWRYPAVELLTAFCLVSVFLKYGWSNQTIAYGVLVLFLIPISFIDIDNGLILNRLTIPGFILGMVLMIGLQIEIWYMVIAGALFGGFLILAISFLGKLLFRKESMGMGDLKLLVMIGVYVGFPKTALCLFYGVFIAALFIFYGIIFKKVRIGDTIPFGPFIAIGTLVHLLFGELIISKYLELFR
jgi:leader peptidase (prepilin peptidase)/N-methyltransferase